MKVSIPTLSYELNTMVRKHREFKGISQEEFAFLIGRSFQDVQDYEDLTNSASYDINHINRYARVLEKEPIDFLFNKYNEVPVLQIRVTKVANKNFYIYKGHYLINNVPIELESYQLPKEIEYGVDEKDLTQVFDILDKWLINEYFKNGITGYKLYQDLLAKNEVGEIELPNSFRPILASRAITTLCNKRKKPKLLPHRKLPKTAEKWLLYKEDV